MNYVMSKRGVKFPHTLTWEWTKNRYHYCLPLSTHLAWPCSRTSNLLVLLSHSPILAVKISILPQPNKQLYTKTQFKNLGCYSVICHSDFGSDAETRHTSQLQLFSSSHSQEPPAFFLQKFSQLEEIFGKFPSSQVHTLAQMRASSSSPPRPSYICSLHRPQFLSAVFSSPVAKFINENI